MGFRARVFPLIFSPYIRRGGIFPIFLNLQSFKEAVQGAPISGFVSIFWFLRNSQSSFFFFFSLLPFLVKLVDFLDQLTRPRRCRLLKSNTTFLLGQKQNTTTQGVAYQKTKGCHGYTYDCHYRRRDANPMGKVTRDFLIFYRLCPTQCFPNLGYQVMQTC